MYIDKEFAVNYSLKKTQIKLNQPQQQQQIN